MSLHAGASSGSSSGGSGGVTIGAAVSGGTPSTLLYVNSGGNLANSTTIPFGVTFQGATVVCSLQSSYANKRLASMGRREISSSFYFPVARLQ